MTVACLPALAQVRVSSLKVNHMKEPSGVVDARPVLSWVVESPNRNVMQQAYEVRVFRDGRSVWRSGRVESQESVAVEYGGEPLASGTRYEWQVRVWDDRGRMSKWSERSAWLTGMMTDGEWRARWILPAEQTDASPMLRKEFTITKPVASAVAYITSHGMYEAPSTAPRWAMRTTPRDGPPMTSACSTRPTTSPRCCRRARTPSALCWAAAGT